MRQAASTRPSALKALLLTLRPEQWIKNLLVFAGVMFGGRLLDVSSLWAAITTFAVFCALSSAVYIFNDIADREADRQHPLKSSRPIAAGDLSPAAAAFAGAGLAGAALAVATILTPRLGLVELELEAPVREDR